VKENSLFNEETPIHRGSCWSADYPESENVRNKVGHGWHAVAEAVVSFLFFIVFESHVDEPDPFHTFHVVLGVCDRQDSTLTRELER
jgi:hypothetical protein